MTRPLVIAHRGASGDLPENTMPAFERAIEDSADMIETDLHLSRDGVVVIHHDAHLDRLGIRGDIGDRTAEELARLNAAPDSEIEARIPTMVELLDRFGEEIEFNLELKVGANAAYDGIEDIVISALEERGLMDRMLLSCFDDAVLERARARSSSARLAVLASPRAPREILKRAERVGAEAINPHCMLIDEDLVRSAHGSGLTVYPYTANKVEEMTRLLDCDVDGIISNFPARLRSLVVARENP
jgi:glycerophosphoryl diester phosphodiesterase